MDKVHGIFDYWDMEVLGGIADYDGVAFHFTNTYVGLSKIV